MRLKESSCSKRRPGRAVLLALSLASGQGGGNRRERTRPVLAGRPAHAKKPLAGCSWPRAGSSAQPSISPAGPPASAAGRWPRAAGLWKAGVRDVRAKLEGPAMLSAPPPPLPSQPAPPGAILELPGKSRLDQQSEEEHCRPAFPPPVPGCGCACSRVWFRNIRRPAKKQLPPLPPPQLGVLRFQAATPCGTDVLGQAGAVETVGLAHCLHCQSGSVVAYGKAPRVKYVHL